MSINNFRFVILHEINKVETNKTTRDNERLRKFSTVFILKSSFEIHLI